MPDFAFIVPNANGCELLPRCLSSLLTQKDIGVEVVVVDNGSTDGSRELARRDFPRVQLREGEAAWGFARAINAGIQSTRSEWVVLFNNDAWLDPSWGLEMSKAIAAQPDFRVFSCQGVSARDPSRFYSLGEVFHHAMPLRVGYMQKRDSVCLDDLPDEVVGPSGYCGIYHRTVFQKIGLLEEDFESFWEDADFNLRCSRASLRCFLAKASIVFHLGSATGQTMRFRWGWLSGRNWIWYLRRHHSISRDPEVRAYLMRALRHTAQKACRGSPYHMAHLMAMVYGLATRAPFNSLRGLPPTSLTQPDRDDIWKQWQPVMEGAWKA